MSYGNKGNNPNFVASGTITAGQVVKIVGFSNGLAQVAVADDGATASADANIGIALESVTDGQVLAVQVDGVCDFATAGAVIAAGSLVTTNASGKLAAAASGDRAFGRLIAGKSSTGATADGALCSILIHGPIDIA
jgi:hypothetical protein